MKEWSTSPETATFLQTFSEARPVLEELFFKSTTSANLTNYWPHVALQLLAHYQNFGKKGVNQNLRNFLKKFASFPNSTKLMNDSLPDFLPVNLSHSYSGLIPFCNWFLLTLFLGQIWSWGVSRKVRGEVKIKWRQDKDGFIPEKRKCLMMLIPWWLKKTDKSVWRRNQNQRVFLKVVCCL